VDIKPPVEGLLPELWQQIFTRALAKDPGARHPTCSAFVKDLLEGAKDLGRTERMQLLGNLKPEHVADTLRRPIESGGSAPEIQSMAKPVAAAGGGKGPLIAAVAGGLLVAGAVGFFLFQKGSGGNPGKAAPVPVVAATPSPEPVKAGPAAEPPAAAPEVKQAPAAKAAPAAPTGPGTLHFNGPYAVHVKLDKKDMNEVPENGSLGKIPPGPHTLEMYSTRVFFKETRAVTVAAGQTVTIDLPPVYSLTVETYPSSGPVVIDGTVTQAESDGSTPVQVTKGPHRVGIQNRPGSREVVVQGDFKMPRFPY